MTQEVPLGVSHPVAKSAQSRIHDVRYDPEQTLAEARELYFEANGFPAGGGYEAKWVDFELGPIPMPFPNTEGRRRAVKVHDLHHVLTGYRTDIWGELEISAWEIGSGCRDHYAAWLLNLGGMASGMLSVPRRTIRAFLRGRKSTNLYATAFDDVLLARRLGDVRKESNLDKASAELRPTTPSDVLALLFWWQVGAWGALALLPLAIPFVVVGVTLGLANETRKGPLPRGE
jgi:hypothetical protein